MAVRRAAENVRHGALRTLPAHVPWAYTDGDFGGVRSRVPGRVAPDSITAIRAVSTLQAPLTGHYDGVAAARTEFKRGSRWRGPGSRFRAVGRALRLPVTGTARGIRRATHAHGAGE